MSQLREEWPPSKRIAFRFCFVVFMLSGLKWLACFFPWTLPSKPYWWLWEKIITRLTPVVFHFHATDSVASSDSLSAWTLQLWTLTIALVATLVWTRAARASEYARLYDLSRTFLRYTLACAMLGYGFDKLFLVQFWRPTPTDLIQTFAGSSPFGLMWRFTGYSSPYQFFGGVLEVLGALMLLWRRTTTLGALILAAVMSNVVMLNFCYQIPVKNFSSEILIEAIYLALPLAPRLVAAVLSRDVPPPAPVRPFPLRGRPEQVRLVAKAMWIVAVVGLNAYGLAKLTSKRAVPPPLWGVYDVESFTVDGAAPAREQAWERAAFGRNWSPSFAYVTGDGAYHLFDYELDAAQTSIKLFGYDDDVQAPEEQPQLVTVKKIDAAHLELDGTLSGRHIHARLREKDLSKATINRRLHFVDNGGFWR